MVLRSFIFLLVIICFSCKSYYYVDGGPRPKRLVPKIKETFINDYSNIDLNAIYISKERNWFFKFYPDNKVGFTQLKGEIDNDILNPIKGKMGYFKIKDTVLTTYIYVKGDRAFYNKNKYTIKNDTIYWEYGNFIKQELDIDYVDWEPDW